MAGKITLYVRDEDLWNRARRASGPGGLSEMVQRCLRDWLDRTSEVGGSASASPLERARRLRQDVEELVRLMERHSPEAGRPSSPRSRSSARRGARSGR